MESSENFNLLTVLVEQQPEEDQPTEEMDRNDEPSFLSVSTTHDLIQFERLHKGNQGNQMENTQRCNKCENCIQPDCMQNVNKEEICVSCVMGAECLLKDTCTQFSRNQANGYKAGLMSNMPHHTAVLKSLKCDIKTKDGIQVTFKKDLGLMVQERHTLNNEQLMAMQAIVTLFPTATLVKDTASIGIGGDLGAAAANTGGIVTAGAEVDANTLLQYNAANIVHTNTGTKSKNTTSTTVETTNSTTTGTGTGTVIGTATTPGTTITTTTGTVTGAGTDSGPSGADMAKLMGVLQNLQQDLHDQQHNTKKMQDDMQSRIATLTNQNVVLQQQLLKNAAQQRSQAPSNTSTTSGHQGIGLSTGIHGSVTNSSSTGGIVGGGTQFSSSGGNIASGTNSYGIGGFGGNIGTGGIGSTMNNVGTTQQSTTQYSTSLSTAQPFSFGDFGSSIKQEPSRDPITRLSEVLEKTLVTKDDKKALSAIQIKSLPRLLNCENEISIADFEIWKRSIKKVFEYYKVDECLAIQLIRTECGLPLRLREAIQQCATVEECFETFSRMMIPLSCLRPQLIRMLTNHPRVGDDEEEQLACLDDMLKKIMNFKAFFPADDINEYETVAALACFQSVNHVSRLPQLTFEFKQKFTQGNKFVDILQKHLDNERSNLYLVTTARSLYQTDPVTDPSFMNVVTDKTPDMQKQKPKYSGGRWGKEGQCGVCKSITTHPFWQCDLLKEVKESRRHVKTLKHVCLKCLKPHEACLAKTENKDCSQKLNRKKGTVYSVLCEQHKVNKALCVCPEKRRDQSEQHVGLNFISLQSEQTPFSEDTSTKENNTVGNVTSSDEDTHMWSYDVCEWTLRYDALYDISVNDEEEVQEYTVLNSFCDVAPECIFLTEKITVENAGKNVPAIVCFDSAAQLSGVALPERYKHRLKAVGVSRKLGIRTAHGKKVQKLPIYNFEIVGKMGKYPISTVNLDLPRPTMSHASCRKLKLGGYKNLIQNKEYENHIYILIGINYSHLFPQRISNKYLTKSMQKDFPHITAYESFLSSNLILGGPLTNNTETILNLIEVEEVNNVHTVSSSKCESDEHTWADRDSGVYKTEKDKNHYDSDDIYYSDDEEDSDEMSYREYYEDDDYYYSDADDEGIDDEDTPSTPVSPVSWVKDTGLTSVDVVENTTVCVAITGNGTGEIDNLIHDEEGDQAMTGTSYKQIEFATQAKGFPVKALYKLFLKEYSQHCTGEGMAGCVRCDDRVKAIRAANVNTLRLNSLITWKKLPNLDSGIFEYSREHLQFLRCLPDGKTACEIRMRKLCHKLHSLKASRQFLNHVVERDHLNGMTQWLDQIDSKTTQGKLLHCIPYLVVFNRNSKTTPLRLVQQANSKFKAICDKKNCICQTKKNPTTDQCDERLSYNTCIPTYNTSLPALQMLATKARISIKNSGSDIAKFFRAVQNCIETQMLNATYLYKNRDNGMPTFDKYSSDGQENQLKILLHVRQLFGVADLPSATTVALQMSHCEYARTVVQDTERRSREAAVLEKAGIDGSWLRCPKCNNVLTFLLDEAKSLIFNRCYVDDVVNFITLKMVFEFKHVASQCREHAAVYSQENNMGWSESGILATAEKLEMFLMAIAILIFRNSNFYLKSFEGTGESCTAINKLISQVKPTVIQPEITKPKLIDIHNEHIKKSNETNDQDLVVKTTEHKPFLTQLALNFFQNGTVGLRTKSIKFPISKTKNVQISSFQDFKAFHEDREKALTRRQLSSLLGQSYDSHTGVQLILPITVLKHVVAKSSKSIPNWDWEQNCPTEMWEGILAAVKLMFEAFQAIQPRCNLRWQMNSVFYCVLMVDASSTLTAHTIFLIQRINLGSKSHNQIQNLSNKVKLGRAMDPSIPVAELTALEKGLEDLCNVLIWLQEVGIRCHPDNVLILSDSSTVILQTRMPPAQLKVKIANAVSRIVVNMNSQNLSPFKNLYYFSQAIKPFLADVLTKANLLENHEQICKQLEDGWKQAMKWLSSGPEVWKDFITRNPPIGTDYEIEIQTLGLGNKSNRNLILQLIQVKSESFVPKIFTLQEGLKNCTNKITQDEHFVMCTMNTGVKRDFKQEIDSLINRKLNHAGTRKGPIYILSLCLYFGLKIKTRSKLDEEDRIKNKTKLKRELGDRNSSNETKSKMEFPHPRVGFYPMAAKHMNSITKQNVIQTPQINFNEFTIAVFYTLREQVITALTAAWPEQIHARLDVFRGTLGNLNFFYGCGRLQTSFANTKYKNWGQLKLRLMQKDSVLANLMLKIAHNAANHNVNTTKFQLFAMQISLKGTNSAIVRAGKNCTRCRLNLIAGASVQQLISNTTSGSSSNLCNIALSPKENHLALDYFGPVHCAVEKSSKKQKLWVLMILSHTTQCAHYQIVQSTSLMQLQCAIEVFCQNWGGVSTVWSDQQSNFLPVCNNFTISKEMAKTITDNNGRKLVNPLKRLLELKSTLSDNHINWRCIVSNCHFHGGVFENMVKMAKKELRRNDFFRSPGLLVREQLEAVMSKVVHILNNRPLVCIESQILTPNHLKYFTVIQHGQDKSLQIDIQSKQERQKLNDFFQLKEQIATTVFMATLGSLQHTSKFNQRARFGFNSNFLEVDDVVVDYLKFRKSKSISRSLARIFALSKNKRSAILYYTNTKNSMTFSRFQNLWNKTKDPKYRKKITLQYLGEYIYYGAATDNLYFLTRNHNDNFNFEEMTTKNTPQQTDQPCLDLAAIKDLFSKNVKQNEISIKKLDQEFKDILHNTTAIKTLIQTFNKDNDDKDNDDNKNDKYKDKDKDKNNDDKAIEDNKKDKDDDDKDNDDNKNDKHKEKDKDKTNDDKANEDNKNDKDKDKDKDNDDKDNDDNKNYKYKDEDKNKNKEKDNEDKDNGDNKNDKDKDKDKNKKNVETNIKNTQRAVIKENLRLGKRIVRKPQRLGIDN